MASRALVAGAVAATTFSGVAMTLVERPEAWPLPTPQQLAYQGKVSGLIHFNMATFFHDGDPGCTAQNWNGCDNSNGTSCDSSQVSSFNPTNLNVSAWVDSLKAIGATHAVLTAKHGCGFLLWPTTQTLPDGSPYRYHVNASLDVASMFATAMRSAGLGVGYYYSLTNNFYLNTLHHSVQPPNTLLPGQAAVTQAQYEDLSIALLTELWTQFGPLTEVWLDGGCGSLCDRVNALLRTLPNAANAVAFNGGGGVSANPVRWCGTEGGVPQFGPGGAVWSTTACPDGWCAPGSGPGAPPNTTNASWYPSGVDFALQQGDHWFWTPSAALHPLSDLVNVYHASVGRNGHLEIDLAIDRTGSVAPSHAAAYTAFGKWIDSCYGDANVIGQGSLPARAASVTVPLVTAQSIDRVLLKEDQAQGQFVIQYTVEAQLGSGGAWVPFSSGTAIGATRIDLLQQPLAGATAVRFNVTSAFAPGHNGVEVTVVGPTACVVPSA